MKKRLNDKKLIFLYLILPLVFFMGLAVLDGTVWCVDSQSYVSMDFTREPVYPLFLLGIRKVFEFFDFAGQMYGQPSYLFCAVIIQSLLWVYTTARLGFFAYKVARDNTYEERARLVGFLAVFFQIAVCVLNRFIAARGSMYSECIMTESLAMPLFVLFNIRLFMALKDYSKRNLTVLFLLCVLISSIRKQMLITLLIWGFLSFVMHLLWKRTRDFRKFVETFILVILAVICISVADRSYNYVLRGHFVEHTGNSKGALDTVLYTAKAEDASLYEKYDDSEDYPNLSELYTRIYDVLIKQELTIDFAKSGYELGEESTVSNSDWVAMASHYADCYDVIGFDVVLPICEEYVAEYFPNLDEVSAQLKEDAVEKVLLKELIKKDVLGIFKGESKAFFYVFKANVLKAFVISVANISPKILITASLIIYILYLTLMFRIGVLRKKEDILLMAFIVITGVFINSMVTGSMIFPQPRYMCYSMGLFYLLISCDILL
ncbi:hypothetical protein [Butyrivibrio proteoclasticus]|nr:hypothetical protein [Butyrivibrio proteoclasticus]